jgi:hypothetical protein
MIFSVNNIKQLIILMEAVYLQWLSSLSIMCVFFYEVLASRIKRWLHKRITARGETILWDNNQSLL